MVALTRTVLENRLAWNLTDERLESEGDRVSQLSDWLALVVSVGSLVVFVFPISSRHSVSDQSSVQLANHVDQRFR